MTNENQTTDTDSGSEGEQDADTLPGAPSRDDDAPVGDTDQHSSAPSPPAQTG